MSFRRHLYRRGCAVLIATAGSCPMLPDTGSAAAATLDDHYYSAFARVDVFQSQSVPDREVQQQESAAGVGTGRNFVISAQLNDPPDAHFAAAGWQGEFLDQAGNLIQPGIGGQFARLLLDANDTARVDFDGTQSAGTDALAFASTSGIIDFTLDGPTHWTFDGIYRLTIDNLQPDASSLVRLTLLRLIDPDTVQPLYTFEQSTPTTGQFDLNASGDLTAGAYRLALSGNSYTDYATADGSTSGVLRGEFALTPIPEPACLGLLIPAGLLLSRRRRLAAM